MSVLWLEISYIRKHKQKKKARTKRTIVRSVSVSQSINNMSDVGMELVVAGILSPTNRLQLLQNIDRLAVKRGGNLRGQGRIGKDIIIPEEIVDGVDGGGSEVTVNWDCLVAVSDVLILDVATILGPETSAGVRRGCTAVDRGGRGS